VNLFDGSKRRGWLSAPVKSEPKRQRAQFLIDSLAIRNAHKLSALNESRVSNRQKKREFFNKLKVAGLPN